MRIINAVDLYLFLNVVIIHVNQLERENKFALVSL